MSQSQTINIIGLEVLAKHGVFEHEKQNSQRFIIDCRLTLNRETVRDALETTVDYAEVCKTLHQFMTAHTFNLIETAADRLCAELFKKYRAVNEVRIEVKKPDAPLNQKVRYVSVETVRRRTGGVYIGLGANLGDREATILRALTYLNSRGDCRVVRQSSIYETKPYGNIHQPDFLNAAAEIETFLTAHELLTLLKQIEAAEGRHQTGTWSPRELDLDILFFGDAVIHSSVLTVPHPDLANRLFVLAPLAELAPGLLHPASGKNIAALFTSLKNQGKVKNAKH